MAYAESSDLFARHDIRTIGDLANDSGVRESRDDLVSNVNVTTTLDDASGEVDVALLKGGRYSTSDLSGLTGNALAHLKRITCDIAMSLLYDRRPGLYPELAEKSAEKAEKHLRRLAKGEDLFDLSANQADTHPQVDGPSLARQSQLNKMLPDRTPHYYASDRPYRWPLYTQ